VHTSLRKKYCHMQWERKGERGRRERIWMSDKWQNNSLKCSWERNPGKEYCGWLLIGCFAFCCCFSFVCLFVSLLAFDTGWPGTHNPLASVFQVLGLQHAPPHPTQCHSLRGGGLERDWGLNSGLHTYKAGTLLFEPRCQSILLWLFWSWDFANYLPRLA
jgi:hypothetical protein